DARVALALAAAEVQGHPSRELHLVGITGTNGKTTTAQLIAAMIEAAGHKIALLGTVGYRIGAETFAAKHTTPEASDIQRFLRRAVDAGCATAVMECSSQALDLHRCDALEFAVAVFTNLTRDHLDYHKTMADYFDAKRRLFDGRTGPKPRAAVSNVDDPYSEALARELERDGMRVWRYGMGAGAQVSAHRIEFTLTGMRFLLRTPADERAVESPLVGAPHIYNILAAVASCSSLCYERDAMARAIPTCAGAPGRLELVVLDAAAFASVDARI